MLTFVTDVVADWLIVPNLIRLIGSYARVLEDGPSERGIASLGEVTLAWATDMLYHSMNLERKLVLFLTSVDFYYSFVLYERWVRFFILFWISGWILMFIIGRGFFLESILIILIFLSIHYYLKYILFSTLSSKYIDESFILITL